MVFGRKVTEPVRPSPPTVDQILEDLKSADPVDPVYTLSKQLLGGLINEDSEGDDLSNPNVLYKKVSEYVASADKLDELSTTISQGTDSLTQSHQVDNRLQVVHCTMYIYINSNYFFLKNHNPFILPMFDMFLGDLFADLGNY